MKPLRPLSSLARHLPTYGINGATVALGIGLVHGIAFALGGPVAVVHAGSAAVCTSLGDLPDTLGRNVRRLLGTALMSLVAGAVVTVLEPWHVASGLAVMAIGFVAMLTLAWGPRAGPVSFTPILAMVFVMAAPPGEPLAHLGWNVLGAALYLGWAALVTALLQPRLRRLALVNAIDAAARLLYTRAGMMLATRERAAARAVRGEGGGDRDPDAAAEALATWVAGEATVAERLQAARDLLFDESATPRARRETAILLHVIDLRDVLLASRLDLDVVGHDALADAVLGRVAEALLRIATALEDVAEALRGGRPPADDALPTASGLFAGLEQPEGDGRLRVLPVLARRVELLASSVVAMRRAAGGADEPLPLTPEQLQRFVAPQAWPLAAVREHLLRSSPVLRHALRMSLALGAAYFLAHLLPWGAHPHWLVLSVAVVLRGNLEQTLARRNGRVLGTLLGCVMMIGVARVHSPALVEVVFLVSVGIAHSFVNVRYWLTATAATVMALLQAHLADPAAGFAIAERIGDTLLGAILGWSFSYVLPSWERQAVPQTIARALEALDAYAARVLAGDARGVEQRLARRGAYDALAALAGAAQRSAVEPRRARLPLADIARLLDHAQRLMAHLSSIRLTLARGSPEVREPAVAAKLAEAAAALSARLAAGARAGSAEAVARAVTDDDLAEALPVEPPGEDPVPWLLRRLQLSVHDALRVRQAADAALERLGREGRDPPPVQVAR
jgi:uncharacterized membrane protein YccC